MVDKDRILPVSKLDLVLVDNFIVLSSTFKLNFKYKN
jgi:hypothetical protein